MSEHSHSDRPDFPSERFVASSLSGHDDINRARQAAEALFAPKNPMADPTPDSKNRLNRTGANRASSAVFVNSNRPYRQFMERQRNPPHSTRDTGNASEYRHPT